MAAGHTQAQRYYADAPQGLKLFFSSPQENIATGDSVQMVTIPSSEGYSGICENHVPMISELVPGVVTVQAEGGKSEEKFFISSGFAVIDQNSVLSISAVEAVPIDQLDKVAAQQGLDSAEKSLSNAKNDLRKAEAQVQVDVHSAMIAAIDGSA